MSKKYGTMGNPTVRAKLNKAAFGTLKYGERFVENESAKQTEIWTRHSPKSTAQYGYNATCANGRAKNFSDTDTVYKLQAQNGWRW